MEITKSNTHRKWLGKYIAHLKTVDSTNKWLSEDRDYFIQNGLVVYADEQTFGKGRNNRTWFGGQSNLYCSIVFHPPFSPSFIPSISLLAGIAVHRTLEKYSIPDVKIKWPNDVLVQGKKICGILCELKWDKSKPIVIIGIGMNLNGNEEQFPDELKSTIVTLEMLTQKQFSPHSILEDFLDQLEPILSIQSDIEFQSLWKEWEKKSSSIGKKIRFEDQGKTSLGYIQGLNKEGKLIVLKEKKLIEILSGEIEFV